MNNWIAILLCLAMTACGGDDDGGGADAQPVADAQPDAQTVYDYCADAPADYTPPAPADHYNEMAAGFVVTYPTENPYSWDKAILGKVLFWEEQLSSDDTVACGTCHRSSAGGSDPRAGSSPTFPSAIGGIHGAHGIRACAVNEEGEVVYTDSNSQVQVTKRKPPTYLDAMFPAELFWDGRALGAFTDPDTGEVAIATGGALESQVVGPPVSPVEMACAERTWPDIHAKLETARPLVKARDIPPDMLYALCANPSYPELFEAAFGDPAITTKRIAFAVATHERTLISNQTPWDRKQNGDESAMTPQQLAGEALFNDGVNGGKCLRCHPPPRFANGQFINLGFINFDDPDGDVGSDTPHIDLGREELTGAIENRGQFRTATLRNVGLREAQGVLHDGVGDGASLDELMAAYNVPPDRDAHTDPRMDSALVLDLTGEEILLINTFMREALTDPRVAAEEYPFDRPKLGSEP